MPDRFSRDRPRFNDTIDMIKFICKDLWVLVFRKQVDNLKTNHRVRSGRDMVAVRHIRLTENNRACTCLQTTTSALSPG